MRDNLPNPLLFVTYWTIYRLPRSTGSRCERVKVRDKYRDSRIYYFYSPNSLISSVNTPGSLSIRHQSPACEDMLWTTLLRQLTTKIKINKHTHRNQKYLLQLDFRCKIFILVKDVRKRWNSIRYDTIVFVLLRYFESSAVAALHQGAVGQMT